MTASSWRTSMSTPPRPSTTSPLSSAWPPRARSSAGGATPPAPSPPTRCWRPSGPPTSKKLHDNKKSEREKFLHALDPPLPNSTHLLRDEWPRPVSRWKPGLRFLKTSLPKEFLSTLSPAVRDSNPGPRLRRRQGQLFSQLEEEVHPLLFPWTSKNDEVALQVPFFSVLLWLCICVLGEPHHNPPTPQVVIGVIGRMEAWLWTQHQLRCAIHCKKRERNRFNNFFFERNEKILNWHTENNFRIINFFKKIPPFYLPPMLIKLMDSVLCIKVIDQTVFVRW